MAENLNTLGLIGGMTWHSTEDYYRYLNEAIGEDAGGYHSAPLMIHSVDFDLIDQLMRAGQWDVIGDLMESSARRLHGAGVDGMAMSSNTIHKVADRVEGVIDVPFLHIVEPTAEAIKQADVGRVALLGTATTMSEDFYKGRLAYLHGLEVDVPDEGEQAEINRIIFDELGYGHVVPESRDGILRVIDRMSQAGSKGVILGCTELGEIVKADDTDVQLFDTTSLHTAALADFILDRN